MKKIIVLGLANSGSTMLCEMMYFLGINFGTAIGDRNKYGLSFEHRGVSAVLSQYLSFGVPIDWEKLPGCKGHLSQLVTKFFDRWSPLDSAIKRPILCAGMSVLDDETLRDLSFINCTRPIENSIKGAIRAYPFFAEQMEAFQNDLQRGKETTLERATALGCPIFEWDYDAMATNGREIVESLAAWLGTNPAPEIIDKALAVYDDSQHHFAGDDERSNTEEKQTGPQTELDLLLNARFGFPINHVTLEEIE